MSDILKAITYDYYDYLKLCKEKKVAPLSKGDGFYEHWEEIKE